jgi:hypothetical protein
MGAIVDAVMTRWFTPSFAAANGAGVEAVP